MRLTVLAWLFGIRQTESFLVEWDFDMGELLPSGRVMDPFKSYSTWAFLEVYLTFVQSRGPEWVRKALACIKLSTVVCNILALYKDSGEADCQKGFPVCCVHLNLGDLPMRLERTFRSALKNMGTFLACKSIVSISPVGKLFVRA
jgi:hypothetical protein